MTKREYKRRWDEANREHVRDSQRVRNRAKRIRNRDFIRNQKRVACFDCGGTFDPVCMDFDHRPGEVKLFDVTAMQHMSLGRIQAEIAKCDVVCANCHRLRTKNRPYQYRRNASAEEKRQLSLLDLKEKA